MLLRKLSSELRRKAEIKVTAIVSGENNDPHIDGSKAVKFVSNVIYLAGFSVQTSDDEGRAGGDISQSILPYLGLIIEPCEYEYVS